MNLPEQADDRGCKARGYHQWLKKVSHRLSRQRAKQSLAREEEPVNTDHKYKGWET